MSIYIPDWYHMYDKDYGGWRMVKDMIGLDGVACWNGHRFAMVDLHRCRPGTKTGRLIMFDSMTIMAENDNEFPLRGVSFQTHWLPPWLFQSDKPGEKVCRSSSMAHTYKAVSDFICKREGHKCTGEGNMCIPLKRMHKIIDIEPKIRWKQIGRCKAVPHISKQDMADDDQLCERGDDPLCRAHSLQYIRTVVALRGLVHPQRGHRGAHTEVKDSSMKIPNSSFMRLRRLMTMCAVLNRHIFKVMRGKNGRHRKERRRVRIGVRNGTVPCLDKIVKDSFSSNRDILKLFSARERYVVQEAKLLRHQKTTFDKWVRMTLKDTNCIIVEGILLNLQKQT